MLDTLRVTTIHTTRVTGATIIRVPTGTAICERCETTTLYEDGRCICARCRDCETERSSLHYNGVEGVVTLVAGGQVTGHGDWLCSPCWASDWRDGLDAAAMAAPYSIYGDRWEVGEPGDLDG